MTVRLWRGYHSPELLSSVQRAWEDETLLVLCPPGLRDFRFLSALPIEQIEFFGDWTDADRESVDRQWPTPPSTFKPSAAGGLHERPVLGVFTSGTLSLTPRLVLYSRRNVLASLRGIYSLFDRNGIRHVFCYPQAFHTFGLTLGYVASHLYGWQLHTPKGKYQSASHQQRLELRDFEVLTLGTPTHFYDLIHYSQRTSQPLQPSYSCIIGGACVSRSLWLKVQNDLHIHSPSIGYGCTEAAPGITHLPPGRAPKSDDAIGFPLASLDAVIRGDQGVEISGASLCIGIIQDGRLEIPKSVVIRDHLEFSNDGWIYRGRLDLSLNRGGAKYSLESIEKTVFEQLGLHAVACGVRDVRLGQDLGLVLQMPDFQEDSHTFLNETHPHQKALASVQTVLKDAFALNLQSQHARFVAEFPLNESSKLDRRSVTTLFAEDPGHDN